MDAAVGGHAAARLRLGRGRRSRRVRGAAERPDGEPLATVQHALGSPQRPMDAASLQAKVAGLGGPEDLPDSAAELMEALCST